MKARLTFISDGGREIESHLIEVPEKADEFRYFFSTEWKIDGRAARSFPIPHPKKVKKEGWLNIYPSGLLGGVLCATEAEAKSIASDMPAATIKIEWEEEER